MTFLRNLVPHLLMEGFYFYYFRQKNQSSVQMDTLVPQVECVSGRRVLWTLTDFLVSRGLWRRSWYHQHVAALNGAPALMTARPVVTSNNFFFRHYGLFVCN